MRLPQPQPGVLHFNHGWPGRRLAKKFKVSDSTISCILRRKNWTHLTGGLPCHSATATQE